MLAPAPSTPAGDRAERPRCLVTGASGLLGRHLLPRLSARWSVHALSRAPRSPGAAAGNGVTWHAGDLGDGVPAGLPERVDAVVHLAQAEHFRDFPDRAVEIFTINAAGVLHLLEYARRAGARRFVLASSGGVYRPDAAPLTEASEVMPPTGLGFYLATKLASELLVQQYARFFTTSILRFFFIYGPGQRDSMLVPRLVRSVREGVPVALQGEEGLRLNPIYATDAARAVEAALGLAAPATINVAGPTALGLRALCEEIGAQLGRAPVFAVQPARGAHDLVASTELMRRLLAPPLVSPAEGIRRYLASLSPV